ncbi:hypothetical protein AVL50_10810 [Flammeovirga sp. SJP92]|nr:hypothetical protein AVL50_10810 [Flammeovirga sp. SJP92]
MKNELGRKPTGANVKRKLHSFLQIIRNLLISKYLKKRKLSLQSTNFLILMVLEGTNVAIT